MNFDALYKKTLKYEIEGESKKEIRASGMPFCPIKFLINYRDGIFNDSFPFRFFTECGNVIHEETQNWTALANPGVLFGNWKCPKCKKVVFRKVGPMICPICSASMGYKEVTLNFLDAPMNGHPDGFLLENILDMWLLELKSTTKTKCLSIEEPDRSHRLQSTLYTSASRKIFKDIYKLPYNIKGYIIKYISRDNPYITSQDFIKEVKQDTLYDNTCKLVNILVSSVQENNWLRIYRTRPCQKMKSVYEECEFLDFCKSELNKKTLKTLWKQINKKLKIELTLKNINLFGGGYVGK